MSSFKKPTAYADVPCKWVSTTVPDIKYYHLTKDEEPPDEFCAVRDVGGEPSEYTFYVSEIKNDKLRELCGEMLLYIIYPYVCVKPEVFVERARELGVEVDG